jgi:hypothetical protein
LPKATVTIIRDYCISSVPLTNDSGNGQIAELDSGAGLFAAVAAPLFAGNLRELGKEERGTSAVSDDSLSEPDPDFLTLSYPVQNRTKVQ